MFNEQSDFGRSPNNQNSSNNESHTIDLHMNVESRLYSDIDKDVDLQKNEPVLLENETNFRKNPKTTNAHAYKAEDVNNSSLPDSDVEYKEDIDVEMRSNYRNAEFYKHKALARGIRGCIDIGNKISNNSESSFYRRHGYSMPLNMYQLISYILFLVSNVAMYFLLIPSFDAPVKIFLLTLYSLLIISTVSLTLYTTRVDPADKLIYETNKSTEYKTISCDLCGPVANKSKHCKYCNKCILVFDHHCIWLNNCIGSKNYRAFIVLLVSLFLMTCVATTVSLIILIQYLLLRNTELSWIEVYGYFSAGLFYGLLVVAMSIHLIVLFLDLQLLMFHVYLIYNHITTYDYITRQFLSEEEKPKRTCLEFIAIDSKKLKQRRLKKNLNNNDVSQSLAEKNNDHQRASVWEDDGKENLNL